MNQGNSQRFRHDDGVWQDGGMLLHFPSSQQWVGVFLAFALAEVVIIKAIGLGMAIAVPFFLLTVGVSRRAAIQRTLLPVRQGPQRRPHPRSSCCGRCGRVRET